MEGRKKPFTTEVTLGKPDESRYPIICRGLIDTGAARTSIDEGLAQTLNLEPAGWVRVRSANGVQRRKLVWLQIEVFNEDIDLVASITDRSDLTCPVLIGRDILHNVVLRDTTYLCARSNCHALWACKMVYPVRRGSRPCGQ